MTDISIIEFVVYGFITYLSIGVLIVSVGKEAPATKPLAIMRSIYIIPGIICASILSSSGINIDTITTSNTIINVNSTETWTESTLQSIVLQNPVWILVHFMIMIVLILYVIQQVLILLGKPL